MNLPYYLHDNVTSILLYMPINHPSEGSSNSLLSKSPQIRNIMPSVLRKSPMIWKIMPSVLRKRPMIWNILSYLLAYASNPQDCSKRFTLYFPGRPVQSENMSNSLERIQPYAAINERRLLLYISTTVYCQVLICVNNLAQCFDIAAQNSNSVT